MYGHDPLVQNTLNRFKIGEPISSLFQPLFYADSSATERFVIKLKARAPDADGIKGIIDVKLEESLPNDFTDKDIFQLMHYMLIKLLHHELDESIKIDGVKVYDPHQWENKK